MTSQLLPDGHKIALFVDNFALASRGASVAVTHEISYDSSVSALNQWLPTHLLNDRIGLAYRTPPLSDIEDVASIVIDLGKNRTVETVVLGGTNMVEGTWGVDLYDVDPFPLGTRTKLYASGNELQPVVRASLDDFDDYYDFPWNLGPPDDFLERMQTNRTIHAIAHLPSAIHAVRYVVINLKPGVVRDNRLDDFYQIAVPFIGKIFRPEINAEYGYSFRLEDDSAITESEAGSIEGVERDRRRIVQFQLDHLQNDEAWDDISAALDRIGKLGRVFVWDNPSEKRYYYRNAFVGAVSDLGSIERKRLEYPQSTTLEIKETF